MGESVESKALDFPAPQTSGAAAVRILGNKYTSKEVFLMFSDNIENAPMYMGGEFYSMYAKDGGNGSCSSSGGSTSSCQGHCQGPSKSSEAYTNN